MVPICGGLLLLLLLLFFFFPVLILCQLKANLMKRKILSKSSCPLCLKEHEPVMHALWEYDFVILVWNQNFGWVDQAKTYARNFVDLVSLI